MNYSATLDIPVDDDTLDSVEMTVEARRDTSTGLWEYVGGTIDAITIWLPCGGPRVVLAVDVPTCYTANVEKWVERFFGKFAEQLQGQWEYDQELKAEAMAERRSERVRETC